VPSTKCTKFGTDVEGWTYQRWHVSELSPPGVLARRQQFGHQLRVLRKERKLSQEVVGQRAGLDRKTVSRIENGHYGVSLDNIFLLADALDVHPTEFFR
jgi:putative transcriptional regulator